MSRRLLTVILMAGFIATAVFLLAGRPLPAQGQAAKSSLNASDEQVTGFYEPDKNWPHPLATLFPQEEGWTWGSTQGIFAQNPNRIFIAMRGELPAIRSDAEPYNVEWPNA